MTWNQSSCPSFGSHFGGTRARRYCTDLRLSCPRWVRCRSSRSVRSWCSTWSRTGRRREAHSPALDTACRSWTCTESSLQAQACSWGPEPQRLLTPSEPGLDHSSDQNGWAASPSSQCPNVLVYFFRDCTKLSPERSQCIFWRWWSVPREWGDQPVQIPSVDWALTVSAEVPLQSWFYQKKKLMNKDKTKNGGASRRRILEHLLTDDPGPYVLETDKTGSQQLVLVHLSTSLC